MNAGLGYFIFSLQTIFEAQDYFLKVGHYEKSR